MKKSLWAVIMLFALADNLIFVQAQQTPTPFPSLESQIGFSDAEIAMLQAIGVHNVNDNLRFNADGHAYQLLSFQPTPYKAHPGDQEYSIGYGTVLLYRTDKGQHYLIQKWDVGIDDPRLDGPFPSPGDWNLDGHVLWGVWESFSTTGWYQGFIQIFELNPDETVMPILDLPQGYAARSVQVQSDGKLLLTVGDYRDQLVMGLDKWSLYTCCGPYIYKYFEWQAGKFVDVSSGNADKYYAQMGSALEYVTTTKNIAVTDQGPALFSLELLRLLVIYDDIGERQAGWQLVQSLIAEAKQSGRLSENTYVDQVFMPTMAQLFKDGKPFVAPDRVQVYDK